MTTEERIAQAKLLITQLETLGTDEVKVQIDALKATVAGWEAQVQDEAEKLVAAAKAKEKEVVTGAKEIAGKLQTFEQTFTQKYGTAAAHGVEIGLLAAILGKLLGAF